MQTSDRRPGVALVSFPWESRASYIFLSDLVRILAPLSATVVVIDGNTDRIRTTAGNVVLEDIGVTMHYVRNRESRLFGTLSWIFKFCIAQYTIAAAIVKNRHAVDIVFFYIIYPYYLIPLIAAKCSGLKTVEIVTRSEPNTLLFRLLSLQNPLVYSLIDGISPESNRLVSLLGLGRYRRKILPEGARFIDCDRFRPKKAYQARNRTVGYVGRLHEEKGVLNLLAAIPLIARQNPEISYIIGGSGDLLEHVRRECRTLATEHGIAIDVPGWIGDDLPDYLNEMALMVLPTYSDALPTIVLEAMACGTPIVATAVGAIPDVVIDGKTGFLLRKNTPECIADTILGVMGSGSLDEVSAAAASHISRHFTYQSAVARFSEMLRRLGACK